MTPEHIKKAVRMSGTVIARHANGNTYHITDIGKMQVNGEWIECAMYYSLTPFEYCCRALTDFEKFTYICNETISGPRG